MTCESCDTLSLLAHAEVPRDLDRDSFRMDVIKVMESTGCDSGSCRRVIDAKELPGILWQVFHPSDADKIRDLLSKILAQEKLSKKRSAKTKKATKKRKGGKPNNEKNTFVESSDDTEDCETVDKNFDVLQEATHYLDAAAMETLRKEYGVSPFSIAQFPGEAIVLPAGAPFQVWKLFDSIQ